MAADAVVLNIHEMIDLAIGTPEVGVVDFCMLQAVLHCLAQQLRCTDKNVELKGNVGILPVGRAVEGGQSLAVNEFPLETDGQPAEATDGGQDTILVVERFTRGPGGKGPKGGGGGGRAPTPKKSEVSSAAGKGKGGKGGKSKATVDDDSDEGPPAASAATSTMPLSAKSVATPPASLVTLSKFNLLENTVNDLKDRVYGSLPKNEEILEEVRSQTNIKAITDMWTNLNVSSRLEAAEEGISKLSSLLQDVISAAGGQAPQSAVQIAPSAALTAPSTPVQPAPSTPLAAPSTPFADPSTPFAAGTGPSTEMLEADLNIYKSDLTRFMEALQDLRQEHDQLSSSFYAALQNLQGGGGADDTDALPPAPKPSTPDGQPSKAVLKPGGGDAALAAKVAALSSRLDQLEKKLKEMTLAVFNPDLGSLQQQISSMQDQIDYRGKPPPPGASGLENLPPGLAKDLQGLMQLFETVQTMQDQLTQVHETAIQLAAEREEKQNNIRSLLEQIELLKSIKLDREDMVEALADKADLRLLARKVSHDQFEMACDDLSKGLEHALGKLNVQEALWQQALDDIQREIETKLDKVELAPVKEFFNNKLKQLQEHLKQMADLRREAQAAGTKKKLLMDVNCISCDANAVMEMENKGGGGGPKPLPAHLSMKPYLSYELDAIRKAQQSNLPQRNMHDWESMNKPQPPPKLQKVRSETDKHICNRYCGGSHTTTTPAQRVARLGHFVKQWGPEVLPLSSEFATGDDGRLYKVTATKPTQAGPGGAADVPCTPKSKGGKDQPKPKPLGMAPECRCLEDRTLQK